MSIPTTRAGLLSFYQSEIRVQQDAIRRKKKIKNRLAAARLLSVLLALLAAWYYWPAPGAVLPALLAGAILLTILVYFDAGKTEEIRKHERLIRINRHEADALQQQLAGYEDGSAFAPRDHEYASDLDLFGPASLFQLINRCAADQSKQLLARRLCAPLPLEQIAEAQEAAAELAGKTAWSQQFRSAVMAAPLRFDTEERLRRWMEEPARLFRANYWSMLVFCYSLLSLSVLLLYTLGLISFSLFLMCVILFSGIAFGISSRIQPAWQLLSRIEPEMNALYEQLQVLEKGSFRAALPQRLQAEIRGAGNLPASVLMRQFRVILRRFDYRLNMLVFFFLNTFLLWDLRQLLALNRWQEKNRSLLPAWISALAEAEVLISLASLARNEPDWCFPEVNDRFFNLSATGAGHPLISAEQRVTNDFSMEGPGRVAVITGSNMAGKSTFLRTLGTNLVLAFMGAPVCATAFRASHLYLLSSMRVADNLAEHTSTFYAELKKLQFILGEVSEGRPVFILLDEVLRGTNSDDRHAGTRALIRQLIRQQAVCVIATHDTELARAESARYPQAISNHHFDGQVRGETLYFDYRLRDGICASLNATLLMKKIGIHFDE